MEDLESKWITGKNKIPCKADEDAPARLGLMNMKGTHHNIVQCLQHTTGTVQIFLYWSLVALCSVLFSFPLKLYTKIES